jgi:Tfp pilus assembly protein PilO
MSARRGPILAAVVSIVVAILVLVGLVLPKASAVHKKQDELTAAQQQETDLRNQLTQLQALRDKARRVKRHLRKLQTRIPPTADLPGLIRFLQNAADASAVDFMSVSPGNPISTPGQPVSTISTQITSAGTFFAVEEFLFKLETLPRAVKVTQLQVGPGPNGLPQLQIAMTAEVYTTDASAGPGSVPGPTKVLPAPAPSASAIPTPTPGG